MKYLFLKYSKNRNAVVKWQWLKVLQRQEVTVIKNKRILKCLLMMVVSLFLILNFSIGVSASGGYDRQEADACITISQRLSVKGGSNTYSRKGAFKKAKRDAGISVSQQPYDVKYEPMRSAEYEGGHIIKDDNGNIIMTREYYFKNNSGETIVIQDHSAGHEKGGQGSHFNIRPEYNTRTGHVPGTQDHYPFEK